MGTQVSESLTAHAPEVRIEHFTAYADITDQTSRVADSHRLLWDVMQNDRARPYHRVPANGNAGDDGCICSNGGTFPHQGGNQLLGSLFDCGSGPSIISKNRVRADEDAVLDRD